ncbi:unnamed protein product [Durusdinium trenchii]|uniref:Uncharacterized protein n=1 Tax=Durusdinium trenchii TaxID=1381693 RepID=A0ABP0QG02_9DINO
MSSHVAKVMEPLDVLGNWSILSAGFKEAKKAKKAAAEADHAHIVFPCRSLTRARWSDARGNVQVVGADAWPEGWVGGGQQDTREVWGAHREDLVTGESGRLLCMGALKDGQDLERKGVHRVSPAPMLPVLQSPHNTSFYTKSTQPGDSLRESSYSSKIWFPLGGAWREQERGLDGEVLRTNIDDGREFVNGCIPNWSSDCAIRSPAAVEHKLSWAYYRMRGMRAALGHTDQVPSSKQSRQQFNFWTDLRPPFRIKGMKRDADDGHPDGPLFRISYCCPLDYVTERKWGRRTAEGTFENLVHGVAEVRIPKDFPQVSTRIIVLSWGRVEIKFGTKPKVDKEAGAVDPKKWSPIAAEFHLRSNCSRLASLRESLHEANLKMAGQSNQQAVRPWQKALMKPSATLADFMKAEQLEQKEVESVKRDLRLRTACAGFIENAG